jgi:hypothetical protein
MSVANAEPATADREREDKAAELDAECGAGWVRENAPGSSGCHELLDRTAMFADAVEWYIVDHPACIANADWYLLADTAANSLRELYQFVGAAHTDPDVDTSETA